MTSLAKYRVPPGSRRTRKQSTWSCNALPTKWFGSVRPVRLDSICLSYRVQAAACSSAPRLSVAVFSFFFDYPHRPEFVWRDLIKGNGHASLESVFHLECPLQQGARLGVRRRVQPIEWAVVTPATVIRPIRTETWVAQFLPPQGPVNQEPQGGLLGALSVQKFAVRPSWNPASSGSMAAFTATTWWMMGTAPA